MMDTIPIPEVEYHEEKRSLKDMSEVCQKYMVTHERPCATVQIDDKVCYAYLNLDGSSEPVQCFIRLEKESE